MISLLLSLLAAAPLCPAPHRSHSVVREFERSNSCPASCATYRKVRGRFLLYQKCGACQVDHVCPLACGGADDVANMQWLPSEVNRKKGADCGACRDDFFLCGERR